MAILRAASTVQSAIPGLGIEPDVLALADEAKGQENVGGIIVPAVGRRRSKKKPVFRVPPPDAQELTLRWYQEKAKREIYAHVRNGEKSIAVLLAGGAGKTALASSIIKDATQRSTKNRKCLFLVDRTVLIEQAALEQLGFGVPCSTLQGKVKPNILRDMIASRQIPAVVASAQTVEARLNDGLTLEEILGDINGPIFVDEGHISYWRKGVEEICEYYWEKNRSPALILTASPWRTSPDEYLGQKCTAQVDGPPIPTLVEEGSLVPARYLKPGQSFDVTSLDTKEGEYDGKQMEQQAISKGLIAAAVAEWEKFAYTNHDDSIRDTPRATAVFCPTVKIAKLMSAEFNRRGYASEWQDGKTGFAERDAQTERLKTGATVALVCCDTLTAGWNCKEVEFIVYFKASKSKQNFFQACWRGDRPCPAIDKKDFFILDFGGNYSRLGWPMDASDYYIGPPKKQRPNYSQDNTKECPNCGAEVARNTRVCSECDHEFTSYEDNDEAEEIESEELEHSVVEVFSKEQRAEIKSFRAAKRKAYSDRRHPAEAIREYAGSRNGKLPQTAWHYACIFQRYQGARNRKKYQEYLVEVAMAAGLTGDSLGFWVQIEMGLEFNKPNSLAPAVSSDWREMFGYIIGQSRADIKKKYRSLCLDFHPDVVCSGEDAVMTQEQAKGFISTLNQAWEDAKSFFDHQ